MSVVLCTNEVPFDFKLKWHLSTKLRCQAVLNLATLQCYEQAATLQILQC